jgi:hypothetical protein
VEVSLPLRAGAGRRRKLEERSVDRSGGMDRSARRAFGCWIARDEMDHPCFCGMDDSR